jgi:S1-C subfamily serine protease/tetratricopeptide (TPR) repeat protein
MYCMRKILVLMLLGGVLTIAALALLASGGDDCRTINFALGPEDIEDFAGAVFRVDDGGDIGTAFLVDSTNGYLLTAKHVVKRTIADNSIEIIGTTPALSGKKLVLQIVDSTPDEQDLALLKVKDPTKTINIVPLDIGLRPPSRGSKLSSMGYPTTYGDEINTSLRVQPEVKVISSPSEDGLIEVTQVAIGGNSGGPLVEPNGLVVGICRKEVGIGDAVARYAPMSDAEPLLNRLPRHPLVTTLDSQVTGHRVTPQELIAALKRGPGHASNLDLYAWARYILERRANYKESANYFSCPIVRAMMHRELDDVVMWLSPFGSQEDLARASLTTAERELSRGNWQQALEIISPVAGELAKSSDLSVQRRSLFVQATSMTELGQGKEAMGLLASSSEHLPQNSKFAAEISGELAYVNAIYTGAYENGADVSPRAADDAADVFEKTERQMKNVGASEQLAEFYMREGRAFSMGSDKDKALEKYELARETYHEIGNFSGESKALLQMAEVSFRLGPRTLELRYVRQFLEFDPLSVDAKGLGLTDALLSEGFKPQDIPGLHPIGNDWLVTTIQDAPRGDAHSSDLEPPSDVKGTVNELNKLVQHFVGPAISQFAGPLNSLVRSNSGSGLRKFLGPKSDRFEGPTQLVCTVYPKDAKLKEVDLWAGEQDQAVGKCSLHKDNRFSCDIGSADWVEPEIVQDAHSGMVCGVFTNRSQTANRTASMTTQFTPPPGWEPRFQD